MVDFLCRNIKTPVVFAHSGALKVKEAFLVALETPNQNLYFDTSFILSFWKGSSVEQDLGFVIKKLGVKRFFFGSDYPYLDFKVEYELQRRFLEALGLSLLEQQYFFNASAQEFLTKLM
jgi:predicted TIM-barrel fold metal-dependent hydrolase